MREMFSVNMNGQKDPVDVYSNVWNFEINSNIRILYVYIF